jgi:hypothetical protein
MPVPNVVAIRGFANRILRGESPVFQRINELAFKAADDLIIPVSPEGDRQPFSVLYKPALVETTLRLRLVDGLFSASKRYPPKLVVHRAFHHLIPSKKAPDARYRPYPMKSPRLDEPLDALDFVRETSGDVV